MARFAFPVVVFSGEVSRIDGAYVASRAGGDRPLRENADEIDCALLDLSMPLAP